MVKEMDQIQQSLGFTGRSELVRSGIRLLLQDLREKTQLTGAITAVVVVTHNEENEEAVTKIKHKFSPIVKTHIHNKMNKTNCVELFLLEGEAADITSMTREFQREDVIKSVKLVTL